MIYYLFFDFHSFIILLIFFSQIIAVVDEYVLVDTAILYQMCPYLWTWKNLLVDFSNVDVKWGDKGAVSRKITPISAEDPSPLHSSSSSSSAQSKSLELRLEENFLHNQPSSVKRTVDFVSDRLASNVVRDVRHRIIPAVTARGRFTWILFVFFFSILLVFFFYLFIYFK